MEEKPLEEFSNATHLSDYARLKAQHANIALKLKALETVIKDDFKKDDVTGAKVEGLGTFSVTTRKKWEYPVYVAAAEVDYKNAKKKSEESGEATFTETQSLTYRVAKRD